MASHHQTQGPAPPPLQEFPPLGAGGAMEQGIFPGSGRQPPGTMNPSRNPNRISGDWRSPPTNPSRGVPTGPHANAPNQPLNTRGGFEGPRSPPNSKSTSHVPCKFFKVGQCQAGKACPFSHSTDASKFEQPCKYFSKGNCKFGGKCALLHVLPNGRVVNKPHMSGGNLNIGGRVDPAHFPNQESTLGSSLLSQQVGGMPQPFSHQIPQLPQELELGMSAAPRAQPFDIPKSSAKFSTPLQEPLQAMSPIPHLTALDAPLPASFDSNGISYIARHGPVAASMPSKVGIESPPPSLPKKTGMPTDAFQNLQESGHGASNRGFNLGSSPSGPSEDTVGQRVMHSQRIARPKMMSASLPRKFDQGWERGDELLGAEEYIPANLSHLMTPEERNRRSSGKVENPVAIRESLSGNTASADMSTRFGSPGHASPSRFSPWNKPKADDEHSGFPSPNYGPVGSPLRNTTLHPGASPSLRAVRGASDLVFNISSPPRQSSTSMISQQLQRTRISSRAAETGDTTGTLHPGIRHTSNPRSAFDRAVSSTSVTNERIDEEQQELVFPLEEDYKPSSTIWGREGITRTPGAANKESWGTKEQVEKKR